MCNVYSHHGKVLHSMKGFCSFKYQPFLMIMNQDESVRIKQSFCLVLNEYI